METVIGNMQAYIRKFSISSIVLEPLCIIVSFYFVAIKNHDYSHFDYNYISDYLLKFFFFVVVLGILHKIKSNKFVFALLLAQMLYSEVLIYNKQLPLAYITFLIAFSTFTSMAIYASKNRVWVYTIQALSMAYVLISGVLHFYLSNDFPLQIFILCFIFFVITFVPMQSVYTKFQDYLRMQEYIISDFKCILEALPYGIAILTTEEGILSIYAANSSIIQFFGNSNELNSFIHSEQFYSYPKNDRIEHHGKIGNIAINKSYFKLFNKEGYILTLHDTTDIIAKEEKQVKENMKWLFVNTANHQLRTPLAAIDSVINLVIPEIVQEEPRKHLQVASLAVTNLRHIIDDTILISEEESSKIKLQPITFILKLLCNEIVQLFYFEANRAELRFTVEAKNDDENEEIIADKSKLMHVIYTLVSNAIKYTPKGYIKVFMSLLRNEHQINRLCITVEDTGLGIDENTQYSMFKIFANEKENKQALKVSSGLGLHVANIITKAMGGTIEFKSEKFKGTTFTMLVDVATPTPLEINKLADKNTVHSEKVIMRKWDNNTDRVLVVDDNMSNVYVIKKMLKRLGVDSDEAHNGVEAVNRFKQIPYRLIFMDINMPVMNGLDASSEISKEKTVTMIVALTAQDEIAEVDYKSHGIEKWIVKPISLQAIKEILNHILASTLK